MSLADYILFREFLTVIRLEDVFYPFTSTVYAKVDVLLTFLIKTNKTGIGITYWESITQILIDLLKYM